MGLSSQTFPHGEVDFLCHNTAEPNVAAGLSLSSSGCPSSPFVHRPQHHHKYWPIMQGNWGSEDQYLITQLVGLAVVTLSSSLDTQLISCLHQIVLISTFLGSRGTMKEHFCSEEDLQLLIKVITETDLIGKSSIYTKLQLPTGKPLSNPWDWLL